MPPEATLTLEPPRFDFLPGKTICDTNPRCRQTRCSAPHAHEHFGFISPQLAALRKSCCITRVCSSVAQGFCAGAQHSPGSFYTVQTALMAATRIARQDPIQEPSFGCTDQFQSTSSL